jgi:hypothetical protein
MELDYSDLDSSISSSEDEDEILDLIRYNEDADMVPALYGPTSVKLPYLRKLINAGPNEMQMTDDTYGWVEKGSNQAMDVDMFEESKEGREERECYSINIDG